MNRAIESLKDQLEKEVSVPPTAKESAAIDHNIVESNEFPVEKSVETKPAVGVEPKIDFKPSNDSTVVIKTK